MPPDVFDLANRELLPADAIFPVCQNGFAEPDGNRKASLFAASAFTTIPPREMTLDASDAASTQPTPRPSRVDAELKQNCDDILSRIVHLRDSL